MTRKNATEMLAPDKPGIARASAILKQGELVAVPTETVYGLAARADSSTAVAKIYQTKGRPSFNPLIVHVHDVAQAMDLAKFDDRALKLAERFWPGPLSLVLPLREDAAIVAAVTAGLPTIALRAPAHPVMRALLKELDIPLAAPSANRSEHISPTCADHVVASLGEGCPAVIDGGPCSEGLESSIVALRTAGSWSLLRPGPIVKEELEATLGPEESAGRGVIEAPGQLARHYSPGKPVRLNAEEVAQDEFYIGFGDLGGDCNLSPSGEMNEAAANLYACLHRAASSPKPKIAVAKIPHGDIGRAINDRLSRAATP